MSFDVLIEKHGAVQEENPWGNTYFFPAASLQGSPDDLSIAWRVANETLRNIKSSVRDRKGGKMYIAGGMVRSLLLSQPINDIDVMCSSEPDWDTGSLQRKGNPGREFVHPLHVSHVVNIISCTYNAPEIAILQFDYTICQVAVSEEGLWCTRQFYEEAHARKLVPTTCMCNSNPTELLRSWTRALKYVSYGFTMEPEVFGRLYKRSVAEIKSYPQVPVI